MEIRKIVASDWTPKYLAYLAPILMMSMMINQFMNLKQIDLFGLSVVSSVLTYPISLMISDLVTEVYGYKKTRKLILICLTLVIITMAFIQLAVIWPPAPEYKNNQQYMTLFSQLPNIVLGTIAAYLTGELLNSFIMSRLKINTQGRFFYLRALSSTAFSQIVCGLVFFVVAFGSSMELTVIISSTFTAVALNLLYEVVFLPITGFAAKKLKQLEGVDYYDK